LFFCVIFLYKTQSDTEKMNLNLMLTQK